MNTKPTGVCILKFVKERELEHLKTYDKKQLKEIIDSNFFFTEHLFKASDVEIISKK